MSDILKKTAETLVANCKTGKAREGLDTLYAPDAVSVEAGPGPDGSDPVTKGVDGIRGKHDWWEANFEVHDVNIDGPFLHGSERFAVIFELDTTHKESGQRSQMKEVAIYTTGADGKIVREEFYYTM